MMELLAIYVRPLDADVYMWIAVGTLKVSAMVYLKFFSDYPRQSLCEFISQGKAVNIGS